MKSILKLFVVLVVLGLVLIPSQNSQARWLLNDGTEIIIRDGGDDGEEMKHEKDKGKYVYFDEQMQKWTVILDFSISPYPLVNREVIWVENE
ncbi:MAG: hypothetical protein N2450_06275 [bacterium]|nr:hypothetical protein [bacterium]